MSPEIISELAPTGVLRAGINLSNFLLVTGKGPAGEPVGVAPDMAREVATRLGVPVRYVTFNSPGELADQAGKGVWDIGLIGAEPLPSQSGVAVVLLRCHVGPPESRSGDVRETSARWIMENPIRRPYGRQTRRSQPAS